jgi:hypothetical protein
VAILNHSQIQELRAPEKIPAELSGCHLGHLKTKLLEYQLVSLEEWHHFLGRVRELMHIWGNSLSFTENELERVTESMFHFIVIELNKMKLKRGPLVFSLVKKAWKGHPAK